METQTLKVEKEVKELLTSLPSMTHQMTTEDYKAGFTDIILTKEEKEKFKKMMLERLRTKGIFRRELTDDELQKVLYEAREKRHYAIKNEQYWERVRNLGTETVKLRPSQIGAMALNGFHQRYQKPFILDDTNWPQFTMLCQYFAGSPLFEKHYSIGADGEKQFFKLSKGIILMGPKGIGKTTMMKMFRTNPHASFTVKSALTIAQAYANQKDGEKADVLDYYSKTIKQPVNANIFRHSELGICFDDLGREDERKHYGNNLNVMAYLLSVRYELEVPFHLTHITTNISVKQIEEMYGTRIRDIFRETFNLITFSPQLTSRR